MDDLISRQAAIDALNGIINRFEQILRDIRESKVDDSVCGMCEYDGAFVGQSGDWCNECPGFEKDDCFKLSDECRKRWLESVKLPPAQPEKRTDEHTKTHACDCISRQTAIDAIMCEPTDAHYPSWYAERLEQLPSAQPERKKGKWIYHSEIGWGDTWLCDQCGEKTTSTVMGKPRANYCPMCGAYMRGENDG